MALQLCDALFIGFEHARLGGLQDALDEAGDGLLGLGDLGLEGGGPLAHLAGAQVPDLAEQGPGDLGERPVGLDLDEDAFEALLDLLARDALAVERASLLAAEIIGIGLRLARRPASGQQRVAARAADGAAQDEVLGDVLAGRCVGALLQARLNTLVCLQADQGRVHALAGRDVPGGRIDVARIDDLAEEPDDGLGAQAAAGQIRREVGMVFEVALEFGLAAEAAGGEALQPCADGGSRGRIDDELLAAIVRCVAVADGRAEHPVALLDPRLHLLDDLAGVLLALQLALGGDRGAAIALFRV
ncbi:hypothetical protein [Pontivivens ytuae]|uniref:Uncharacterized protein n=1 Tax=Pontivivens ytuae TaxID=2789856 RepID=A0A7S9LQL5_9RHOB|nr:hypothetical protein [Pontivivens ytuae]QPH53306.1 hypothetical protein I0K15_16165 [Pontivivens ytuae]